MYLLSELTTQPLQPLFGQSASTLLALGALALTCGLLSLIVVWRRWAFLGEGIAHAGFGGAGSAWLLAALFPSADRPGLVDVMVVLACLLTAGAIGLVARSGRVHSDTAIGAFLAGTLAWGFLGQQAYQSIYHRAPAGFSSLLFGQTQLLSWTEAQLAISVLVVTIILLAMSRRAVLLYCFDPELASASGIRTGPIHYLLILLISLAIVSGARLIGTVLITALLILPGATAGLLTSRLKSAVLLSSCLSLLATCAGLSIAAKWPALPEGPLIVLVMFGVFILAWLVRRRG